MPTKIPGYTVSRAELEPGLYRTVSGTDALAWGLVSGLKSSGLARMVFASYPITPASPLLHMLARMKELGVVTFQAEDEIAAACAAIGVGADRFAAGLTELVEMAHGQAVAHHDDRLRADHRHHIGDHCAVKPCAIV